MTKWDYVVVGAGPAGAVAAYTLARKGYKVAVLEMAHKPGLKPCGRGIPKSRDLPVSVPRECVLQKIRAAELHVDDSPAFETGGVEGYIVDRTCLFESLISEASDVILRSRYDPKQGYARINGIKINLDPRRVILATGFTSYPGEKINAYQEIYRGEWPEKLTIFFDTKIIGYYWIFPAGPGRIEIGVGGFAGFDDLRSLLNKFKRRVTREYGLKLGDPERREGARIAVGGLHLEESPLRVGESAGFVLPLTGEGIRPSMISAWIAAEAIAEGENPLEALKRSKIAKVIGFQRRVLEAVKAMTPRERAELLLSIPEEIHVKMALGDVSARDLIRALLKKPKLLAKIRYFL